MVRGRLIGRFVFAPARKKIDKQKIQPCVKKKFPNQKYNKNNLVRRAVLLVEISCPRQLEAKENDTLGSLALLF